MEGFNLLHESQWKPLEPFGYDSSFFSIDRTPVINTWLILGFLLIVGLVLRFIIKREKGTLFYLAITFIKSFKDVVTQTLGFFSYQHFSFITALFVFIILCNSISLIPGAEEPTRNLNTTLALGIISFLYVQYYAIKAHGIKEYAKEYFDPFFVMLPLNIIGKLASIISLSFRLFGNIFGGSTIAMIYFNALHNAPFFPAFETIGALSGINLIILLFFGLFEGVIQAFVFAMITVTYLAIAITHEDPSDQLGIP